MAGTHLAVLSWLAVTRREESSVSNASTTQPVWPEKTWTQLPLNTSQARAVKSEEQVMALLPSRVSATLCRAPAAPPPSSNCALSDR